MSKATRAETILTQFGRRCGVIFGLVTEAAIIRIAETTAFLDTVEDFDRD